MLALLILAGLGLLIWAYALVCAEKDKKAALRASRAFLRQHDGWDSHVLVEPMGPGLTQSVLAVNHDRREVVLGRTNSFASYPWSAIARVEVVKNGHTVTDMGRGSQLMGAAIGGVIAGEAGLIAGGLSGRSITREKICELSLSVVVDDCEAPIHTIVFLHHRDGVLSESSEYRNAIQLVDRFHALLVNAMRAEQRIPAAPASEVTQSTIGELERLWRLKELGALTDSEFILQKGALIPPQRANAAETTKLVSG